MTCLPPSPFPAEAWVGAQQLDALEASLDPSRGALPGGVGGPMLEPIGIGLVCHLHTHPSISPVFVGCQLPSAHSGRAARGLCSPPLCAKQSTFTAELTGSSEQQGRRGSQGVKANSRK